jgi:hypothetical protein
MSKKEYLRMQPPASAGSSLVAFSTLKMEAIGSSETSIHTRSTWRCIPEGCFLHSDHCEKAQILQEYLISRNRDFNAKLPVAQLFKNILALRESKTSLRYEQTKR